MLIQSNIVYKSNFSFYLHALLQKLFMNRIKEVLQEKGIKQSRSVEKLGKIYPKVNSYVQSRKQPSIEDLIKIADILNEDVTSLLISTRKKSK